MNYARNLPSKYCILNDSRIGAYERLAYELACLRHLGRKSSWWPYIAVLPTHYSTVPCTYAPELLQLLPPDIQGIKIWLIGRDCSKTQRACKIRLECNRCVSPFVHAECTAVLLGLDYRYHIPLIIVNTRCVCLPRADYSYEDNIALVPFFDMFNHRPGEKVLEFSYL